MKRQGSRVNLVKREVQTRKCTSILIFMIKRQKTPKKAKKSLTFFFRHVTSAYLPQFSSASLQASVMRV